jgi:hypothetical protein
MKTITAKQHAGMHQPASGYPVWTVADAAEATGAAEASIRRAIRRDCSVERIAGPTVAGMIEIRAHGCVGYIPYHR